MKNISNKINNVYKHKLNALDQARLIY